MATTTEKLGLPKPSAQDKVNIADLNLRMDILDNAVMNTRKVNGHSLTADVTVTKSDVGLGNVNNTSDANKPISTAQQQALDRKVDAESGKGLSTNDFSTAEKTKLAAFSAASAYALKADITRITESEIDSIVDS